MFKRNENRVMKKEITLKDFDQFLAKENYENLALEVDVSLLLDILKIASKHGLKTVRNIHMIQLAAKLVELAIEDKK